MTDDVINLLGTPKGIVATLFYAKLGYSGVCWVSL